MNSRKYPRTLNEAFTRTAEYGAAIERPAPRNHRISLWVIAAALLCLTLMSFGATK